MTLRVVFADDSYLVRVAVSALLSQGDEIELITAVGDADALIRAVAEHRPDAVLTDIRMPPTHTTEGIDAAKRIRADYPDIGVVVLSQFADDDYAFELLENGVGGLGYLLKERVAERDELVRALQEVARGGSALDPKVIEALLARKSHEQPSALLGLSDREHEVLQQRRSANNRLPRPLHERSRSRGAHRLDSQPGPVRRGQNRRSVVLAFSGHRVGP
jgi:DNA-binding NarL/FixJ family response regulator